MNISHQSYISHHWYTNLPCSGKNTYFAIGINLLWHAPEMDYTKYSTDDEAVLTDRRFAIRFGLGFWVYEVATKRDIYFDSSYLDGY